MKQLIWVGIAVRLCVVPGFAQTVAAPVTTPPPPAVAPPSGGPDTPPLSEPANTIDSTSVQGAGLSTETQARKHLESNGYSQVSALTKGENGAWHGDAMKNGSTVHISVDHLGNIATN